MQLPVTSPATTSKSRRFRRGKNLPREIAHVQAVLPLSTYDIVFRDHQWHPVSLAPPPQGQQLLHRKIQNRPPLALQWMLLVYHTCNRSWDCQHGTIKQKETHSSAILVVSNVTISASEPAIRLTNDPKFHQRRLFVSLERKRSWYLASAAGPGKE